MIADEGVPRLLSSPTKTALFGAAGAAVIVAAARAIGDHGPKPFFNLYAAVFVLMWAADGYRRSTRYVNSALTPKTVAEAARSALGAGLFMGGSIWVLLYLAGTDPRDRWLSMFLGVSTAVAAYRTRRSLPETWKTAIIAPGVGLAVTVIAETVAGRI